MNYSIPALLVGVCFPNSGANMWKHMLTKCPFSSCLDTQLHGLQIGSLDLLVKSQVQYEIAMLAASICKMLCSWAAPHHIFQPSSYVPCFCLTLLHNMPNSCVIIEVIKKTMFLAKSEVGPKTLPSFRIPNVIRWTLNGVRDMNYTLVIWKKESLQTIRSHDFHSKRQRTSNVSEGQWRSVTHVENPKKQRNTKSKPQTHSFRRLEPSRQKPMSPREHAMKQICRHVARRHLGILVIRLVNIKLATKCHEQSEMKCDL